MDGGEFATSDGQWRKHKPQIYSLSSDIVLFFNSGIITATIIFDCNIKEDRWARGHTYSLVALAAIAYFLGIILGSSICSSLVPKWTKKRLKHVALGLFYVSGTLLTVVPTITTSVVLARILSGVATGFTYLTYIIHGGEIAVPRFRGLVLSFFNVSFSLGILFGTVLMALDAVQRQLPAYRVFGVVFILCTVLAQMLLYFYETESPVFLLQKEDTEGAARALARLRTEPVDSWDVRNSVHEFKAMIVEDHELNTSIFAERNSRPLVLITLTKALLALSFNYPLNVIRIRALDAIIDSTDAFVYGAMTLAAIKVLVIILTISFVDFLGRRRLIIVSGLGAGALALILGILLWIHVNSRTLLAVVGIVVILFELVSNVGVTFVSYVLSSEAFPIPKKPTSISFIVAVENAIQVILLLATFAYSAKREFSESWLVPVVFGTLMLLISGVVAWKLPETNRLSMQESVRKFKDLNINNADGITYA